VPVNYIGTWHYVMPWTESPEGDARLIRFARTRLVEEMSAPVLAYLSLNQFLIGRVANTMS